MQTMFNKYIFPDESVEDHWETLVSFYNSVDLGIYSLKNIVNSFLCGGGTKTWDSGSGLFTWTEMFVIPLVMSGFLVNLKYGADGLTMSQNLQDGYCLVAKIPSVITENRTLNMSVVSKLSSTDGYYVIAYRHGTKLYLRNGEIL